jgi:hypothetical protein
MNEFFCNGDSFFVLNGKANLQSGALGNIMSSKTKGCDFE